MARRSTAPATAPIAPPAEEAAPETPVRRRRRRSNPDPEAQIALLVTSLLRSRAGRGAGLDALQAAVAWARGVNAEAEEIRTLASRPRRLKSQVSTERQAAFELNQSLLASVLNGSLDIDVDDDGGIVFIAA